MSSSNAAAKKRRAPILNEPPQQQQPQTASQNISAQGLTLPQVISLIDKRLMNLETFMVESKSENNVKKQVEIMTPSSDLLEQNNEFNRRFDELADEIANMKNIVLSLQSYTMDVNKMLMEERIQSNELTEEPIESHKYEMSSLTEIKSLIQNNLE